MRQLQSNADIHGGRSLRHVDFCHCTLRHRPSIPRESAPLEERTQEEEEEEEGPQATSRNTRHPRVERDACSGREEGEREEAERAGQGRGVWA